MNVTLSTLRTVQDKTIGGYWGKQSSPSLRLHFLQIRSWNEGGKEFCTHSSAERGPLIEKQQNKNPIWNSFGPKFSRFPELPEWNLLGTFPPPPFVAHLWSDSQKRRRGPPSSNLVVHREQRSQRWGGGLLVVDRTVLELFVEKWKWKKGQEESEKGRWSINKASSGRKK